MGDGDGDRGSADKVDVGICVDAQRTSVDLPSKRILRFAVEAVLVDADAAVSRIGAIGDDGDLARGPGDVERGDAVGEDDLLALDGRQTIEIGGGTVEQGSFSDIDWGNGPYFLKTETDPNGGTNYTIEGTQQLMSVPYALYAGNAGNSFSGDYNDLTNTPESPTVPANVSAFTNDAGYITMDSVPTVPANVSAFTNDAGYITMESVPAGLTGSNTGDVMYWDAANSRWIMVPVGNPGQVLTVENGVPTWANLPDYATLILPPTVTTSAPSEVTQSSALCGGEVTSDGNVQLTACGLCWGTHHFPTTADAHTEGDLSVRAFTSHISGLAHHTTYYVRAYATNSVGTAYGAEMTFTTEDIPSIV